MQCLGDVRVILLEQLTPKTLYEKQMQQEIIIQMCNKINKGNNFKTMQLGMLYNLVLELYTVDHTSTEQRWRILTGM